MFERTKAWYKRNKLEIVVSTLLLVMLLILFIHASIVTITPGQEGVRWKRFFSGTQMDRSYKEGTAFMWPWDKMYLYNMRMQKVKHTYDVLAKNGVQVDVEITLHYRPIHGNLTKLHKYIGPEYIDILILPQIGSHARELFASYEPEELFSIHREQLEHDLLVKTKAHVFNDSRVATEELAEASQYIIFENLFVTSMVLPERVTEAIEEKEAIKQASMAYDHRLQIAEKEKQRKRIEAEGIRDFQNTINDGISDKYLAWKGIDATVELAKSDNSKVVVIGGGKEGMPLILGGDYTANPQINPVVPAKADADQQQDNKDDNP